MLSETDRRLAEKIVKPGYDNYRSLVSYQKAEVIYDITFHFAHRFLGRGDRTVDQMIQAARSGKQNIAEGCAAGATRMETEIQLLNVAKASMKELLEDYQDYLRTRGAAQWAKGSREFEFMRKLGAAGHDSAWYLEFISTRPAETIANMAIVLLNQFDFLIFKQIASVSADAAKDQPLKTRIKLSEEDAWRAREKEIFAEREAEKAKAKGDPIALLEVDRKYSRMLFEHRRFMPRSLQWR